MDYYNLLIALLVLVCLFIVLLAIYVLNHHVKRDRKIPSQDQDGDLEANVSSSQQQSCRPGVAREHNSDDSRLSHLTTVAPSIELLPEIRTNKDSAEDWLDRRESRAADGDIGLEPITMRGVQDDGDTNSTPREERGDSGGKDEKRSESQR